MMMPFKRQALVEFDSVESAERCVSSEAACIGEQQAFFNFSTSQRITRPTNADDPTSGNKVLLLSIQNPLYPITTVSPAEPPRLLSSSTSTAEPELCLSVLTNRCSAVFCLSQDVLYTVCNPVSNVQRIVIFKRNGIQAMVEYPD